MISKCKKNYKLAVAFILGIIVSGLVVYAATQISSTNVSYDNSTSGLSSTTLKGAIDELYEKVPKGNKNIVAAYTYNANSCIAGTESTCKKTTCYENKTGNSCPSGTLIEFKVNSNTTVMFNVMYDKGNDMIMLSQNPTVSDTIWISTADYVSAGGTNSDYGSTGRTTKGPLTALKKLESATSGWNNVKNQTYTLGTTIFATNKYLTCSLDDGCTSNSYTLASRTARARMITFQEAVSLGCDISSNRGICPAWLTTNMHWTASTTVDSARPWIIGSIGGSDTTFGLRGSYHLVIMPNNVRAVVEVSK